MTLRSSAARKLIAGLCLAGLLCVAVSPVAFGHCAIPVSALSFAVPGHTCAPLRADAVFTPAQARLPVTAARPPPLA